MTIDRRDEWLALLEEEFARRSARDEWEAGQAERARARFIDVIEQMAERLRRDPNWREPSEAEAAESAREVEAYFRTRPALVRA